MIHYTDKNGSLHIADENFEMIIEAPICSNGVDNETKQKIAEIFGFETKEQPKKEKDETKQNEYVEKFKKLLKELASETYEEDEDEDENVEEDEDVDDEDDNVEEDDCEDDCDCNCDHCCHCFHGDTDGDSEAIDLDAEEDEEYAPEVGDTVFVCVAKMDELNILTHRVLWTDGEKVLLKNASGLIKASECHQTYMGAYAALRKRVKEMQNELIEQADHLGDMLQTFFQ